MSTRSAAVEIIRTLRERGHQGFLVGGCVRDLLLGREPADYDVSTDATPDQVMRIFPQTYEVGAQFGVVLVPIKSILRHAKDQGAIEVATFRKDGIYLDGRHPDAVHFTNDPEEDVQRRDFTINGLMLDPLDGDRILDFV